MLFGVGHRFTPEDVYAGTLLGALEVLDAGITTVMDWAHIMRTPDHADASVRALRDSGVRAVFGYGNPHPPAEIGRRESSSAGGTIKNHCASVTGNPRL